MFHVFCNYVSNHLFLPYTLLYPSSSYFQALQKICLANHICSMADLLHVDAMQQLEVALLGSPVAGIIDLLAIGLPQSQLPLIPTVQPPLVYTSTPLAPPPPAPPIMGVTSLTPEMTTDERAAKVPDPQEVPQSIPKHCCIILTLIPSSEVPPTSSISSSCAVVVMLELAIPADAYLDHINRPGGGKDYLCHLCSFHHFNFDCILTHVRKHLDFTIICPGCGKGFQNVASLHKHGREVHKI